MKFWKCLNSGIGSRYFLPDTHLLFGKLISKKNRRCSKLPKILDSLQYGGGGDVSSNWGKIFQHFFT